MMENKTKIDLKNKSIFITGVAGFIGSNLAKRLLSTVEGVKVVGLDNMNHYYDVRLKEARLNELEQFENFSFVKGNLADKAVIESIFEQYKPEIVVNLGAQAGVRYSITNPDAYVEANLIGFYNILEACRHSYDEGHTPVEHLVYASSSSVYEYGYYIIITFVYGVSASMILPFVSVYTKKYTDIPYVDVKLAVLFMLIGFANNIRIPCLTMINAAGHFKETQWRAILEAVINITVSLLLIKPLGMYGLLIGTICSFAYRTTDIIYYSHKHILNISCKKSVLRVLRVALVIAINVILYKLLVGKYIMNGWGEWIMYAVIASIIVLVTTGLIYFITEKKQFLACMNLIIKRKVKR